MPLKKNTLSFGVLLGETGTYHKGGIRLRRGISSFNMEMPTIISPQALTLTLERDSDLKDLEVGPALQVLG